MLLFGSEFNLAQAVLNKGGSDPALRFPPYSESKLAWLKRIRSIDAG
jgi:hypothetical protein